MPDIVIIPAGESLSVSPTSSGFAHGFGLFETIRYAGGKLDFWAAHWERLAASAEFFGLALPHESSVLQALTEYVTTSNFDEAILKLSLIKEGGDSRLFVYSRPPMPAPQGRRLLFDREYPILPSSLLAGHKTHNYMETMYLLEAARSKGYYDRLRVDSAGFLAETTAANLFFLEKGRVLTPSLATGILPGVIRGALVHSPSLEVEEGTFAPERLLGAELVFVTNSTTGIAGIEGIDGLPGRESIDFQTQNSILEGVQSEFFRLQTANARELI